MISIPALEMLIPVFHEKKEEYQTTISVWKNDPMQILLNSVEKFIIIFDQLHWCCYRNIMESKVIHSFCY